MIRPITQSDVPEVCARAARALDEPESAMSVLFSGSDVIIAIRGVPIQNPRLVEQALNEEGLFRVFGGAMGWLMYDAPVHADLRNRKAEEKAMLNALVNQEDPAFPSDGGIERPIASIRWYPTYFVPEGATCPFCARTVAPCAAKPTNGPPCDHARWKPAPSSRGTVYAHSACVDAAEAHDSAAKACREWEGAKAEETRAWELAKIATELRLRAEKTYQDAMAGRVP